tara:strand:+ start:125 stop:649 length:525 start_codon:yes stop_codon:yes gene_type:complete
MAIDKIQSESINLADNFAFTGTVTGAGESNSPYFTAYNSGNQTGFSNDTITVMAMNTALQNASEYNTSNYRFTPQTAGKFYLWNVVHLVSLDNTGFTAVCQIRKNGSAIANTYPAISTEGMSERFRQCSVSTACVESANGSSDYFDFTFGLSVSSGSNYYLGTGSRTGGFLLKT